MHNRLVIRSSDAEEFVVRLIKGTMRFGSDSRCEVHIDHPEVAPHAATLKFRDGSFLLQNRNPFAIYIDRQQLEPMAWGVWQPGASLQLTRAVSIRMMLDDTDPSEVGAVDSKSEVPAAEDAADSATKNKSVLQMAVIGACAVVGLMMMMGGGNSTTAEPVDSPSELVEQLNQNPPPMDDAKIVCRYFQEAWLVDSRNRPDQAIQAYRVLLNHASVRKADLGGDTIAARIKRFASRRLAKLES